MRHKCEHCRDWRVCNFGQEVMQKSEEKKMDYKKKVLTKLVYVFHKKFRQEVNENCADCEYCNGCTIISTVGMGKCSRFKPKGEIK